MESVDNAAHVATQPVQTPDNEGVTFTEVLHALSEARTIIACTRHHIVEDLPRTGSGQRLGLLLQGLPVFDQDALFGGVVNSVSFARICWIWASCAYMCAWICFASSNTAEASS